MELKEVQGKGLKYLAIEPNGYDQDQRYPMVILLHGFGAGMGDLAGLCPSIDPEGYVYICPNAPIPFQIGPGMVGYGWTPPRESATPEDARRAEDMLAALFDEVMEVYQVEPGRVVLGGFSQGGMMTFRCGLPDPETFRGLVVLSSRVQYAEELSGRLPLGRSQPIFIAHGTADPLISLEDARESRNFLESHGYKPDYREYSMAHEINQDVLRDFVPWIHDVLPPLKM